MVEARCLQRRLAKSVVLLGLCSAATWAQAQAVYKCQSQGKTTYSQEACPGGVVVDTTPSRGVQSPSERPREAEPATSPGEARPAMSREARQFQCKHLDAAATRNMQGALTVNAELARSLVHQAEEQRKKYVALGCAGVQ